jgi:hypothetical protein
MNPLDAIVIRSTEEPAVVMGCPASLWLGEGADGRRWKVYVVAVREDSPEMVEPKPGVLDFLPEAGVN